MIPVAKCYPCMTAAEATGYYGKVFGLTADVPCDLPKHVYRLSDEPLEDAVCSVPLKIGSMTGYLNFLSMA